ncbi:MAG: hypothetical protein HY273_07230 [Gammaproteobacteria bacterium]|nr:hypothetical protein [Gammaproteobacteria bacterium]
MTFMINLLPIGGFWRLIAIIFLLSIIQQNLYATTPQEGRITHDLAELKPLWFSRATALGLARGRPNRLADRLNTSPANGKPQLVFQRGHSYLVHNATFSPNGNLYASSDTSGTILVWETKTGKLLRPLIGYTGSVRELVFDWSGALLASQGDDKIIRVWDVTSGTVLHSLEATCFDIAFRDASAHLLCSQSGEVFEWSWDDSQGPSKALVYKGASDLSLRWNKRLVHPYYPGGSLVSFKLDDKAIHRTFAHGLWEPTSKRLLIPSPDHIDERITFSRDGDLVASVVHESGEASYLRIWNIRTNEILRKILALTVGPLLARKGMTQSRFGMLKRVKLKQKRNPRTMWQMQWNLHRMAPICCGLGIPATLTYGMLALHACCAQ